MSKIIERLQAIAYTAQTNPTILTGDDIAFAIQNIKSDNGKVAAQAYSTIGHIGLNHPEKVMRAIDSAFASLKDSNWEIREQAVLAIGRTGRPGSKSTGGNAGCMSKYCSCKSGGF